MKGLFSSYREAMRRIGIPLIILASLMLLVSVMLVPGFIMLYPGRNMNSEYFMSIHGVFAAVPYACAVLAFVLLMPFTKRRSSDFYHSVPIKRMTLFLSGTLAIFTAAVILSAIPLVAGFIDSLLYKSKLFLPDGKCLLKLAKVLADSFSYASVICAAMALTGTLASSAFLILPIFAVPPLIWEICTNVFYSNMPFLIPESYGTLFPSGGYGAFLNADAALLTKMLIFSAVSAIILSAVGCLLFVKRKSETAEKSSPGKVTHYIFGGIAGFAVSLFCLSDIIGKIVFDKDTETPVFYSVIIGLTAVTVFAYELITSKSFKKIYRALISAAIVILLDVLAVVLCAGAYTVIKNERFEANGIRFIHIPDRALCTVYGYDNESMITGAEDQYSAVRGIKYSYGALKTNDYYFSDSRLLELTEKAYDKTVKEGRIGNNFTPVQISINTNTGTLKRRIFFNGDELKEFFGFIAADEDFREAYASLPPKELIKSVSSTEAQSSFISVGDVIYNSEAYTANSELYEIFSSEFMKLDEAERLSIVSPMSKLLAGTVDEHDRSIRSYKITLTGDGFESSYYIFESLMPETFEYIRNGAVGSFTEIIESSAKSSYKMELYVEYTSAMKGGSFIKICYDAVADASSVVICDSDTGNVRIYDVDYDLLDDINDAFYPYARNEYKSHYLKCIISVFGDDEQLISRSLSIAKKEYEALCADIARLCE